MLRSYCPLTHMVLTKTMIICAVLNKKVCSCTWLYYVKTSLCSEPLISSMGLHGINARRVTNDEGVMLHVLKALRCSRRFQAQGEFDIEGGNVKLVDDYVTICVEANIGYMCSHVENAA